MTKGGIFKLWFCGKLIPGRKEGWEIGQSGGLSRGEGAEVREGR